MLANQWTVRWSRLCCSRRPGNSCGCWVFAIFLLKLINNSNNNKHHSSCAMWGRIGVWPFWAYFSVRAWRCVHNIKLKLISSTKHEVEIKHSRTTVKAVKTVKTVQNCENCENCGHKNYTQTHEYTHTHCLHLSRDICGRKTTWRSK